MSYHHHQFFLNLDHEREKHISLKLLHNGYAIVIMYILGSDIG